VLESYFLITAVAADKVENRKLNIYSSAVLITNRPVKSCHIKSTCKQATTVTALCKVF